MRLRNKKTGEIKELQEIMHEAFSEHNEKSLMNLEKEWENYEEPFSISFYTIVNGKIKHCIFYRERVVGCPDNAWAYIKDGGREDIEQLKAVGLYFETEEEAELAVRKLKAWKRLKDKGFRFNGIAGVSNNIYVSFETDDKYRVGHVMYDEYSNTDNKLKEYNEDLMLLFGGEE